LAPKCPARHGTAEHGSNNAAVAYVRRPSLRVWAKQRLAVAVLQALVSRCIRCDHVPLNFRHEEVHAPVWMQLHCFHPSIAQLQHSQYAFVLQHGTLSLRSGTMYHKQMLHKLVKD